MRIKILRVSITILFIIIAADLFYVQVIRGRYFFHLSKNNRMRVVPLEGFRGNIKDRHGTVLAENRMAYNVMVTPQDIVSEQDLFGFLEEALGIPARKIIQKYQVNKFTPFAPVVVVEDIEREKAIVLEENKYRYPSLLVAESFKRVYPLGRNSAHVLGYVGKINRAKKERFKEYGYSAQSFSGYTGVEEYYDSYLKGGQGGLQIEVNSRGQQVRLLSFREPTRGSDITLTIDADIQKMSLELLEDQPGAIVVMDTNNGEVLGLVSSPAYDPNHLGRGSSRDSPFFNRAIQGLFPPGSVFKVPVAVGGLSTAKITRHTPFICDGFYELGGIKFRCSHRHGRQNLVESLAHSCNVYYYHLGLLLGAETINRYARIFGLDSLTHIDLPFEKAGRIPSRRQGILSARRRWYAGDTLNFSIGQGDVLTTPIQLVRMMGTVASDGIEVQPHLIKRIADEEINKYSSKRRLKIDKEVFEIVRKGLRAAVTDFSGTAHVLDLKELYVAGKTGTAQTGRDRKHHAWFVGYAKGEQRDITFCVFLEHGGSSQNACLIARQLLLRMRKERIL